MKYSLVFPHGSAESLCIEPFLSPVHPRIARELREPHDMRNVVEHWHHAVVFENLDQIMKVCWYWYPDRPFGIGIALAVECEKIAFGEYEVRNDVLYFPRTLLPAPSRFSAHLIVAPIPLPFNLWLSAGSFLSWVYSEQPREVELVSSLGNNGGEVGEFMATQPMVTDRYDGLKY